MSLYIPPPPKRRRSIWPVIGLGLGLFVLGGAVAFGIAMWMTLEQRTSIAGLTAQMQQAGVSRAADVETIVLPRAQTAAAPGPAGPSTQPMPSVPDEIGQLADAVAGGDHGVAVIRGADGRPVLRLQASGGDAALDRITARLPGAVQDGTLALPPGLALPDGDIDAHSLLYHVVQARLRAGDAPARAMAEALTAQAIASLGADAIAAPDGHVYTLRAGDNLALVALVFYGDLNAHDRIVAANPNTLAGAGALTAGQRLRIPGA